MKNLSIFLALLFFLPFTLHAKIDKKNYKSKSSKISGYAGKAGFLFYEATQCGEDQEEKIISLLEEAIANRRHALALLHELIEELQKAKPKGKSWRAEALENCKTAAENTKVIIEEGYVLILNRNKWNLCIKRINHYNRQIDNKKGEVNQKLADLPNLTDDQKIQHLRGSIELVKEVSDLYEKSLDEISRLQDPAACKGIEPIRIQTERSLEENRNFLALLEKETFQLDEAVRSKDCRAEALKLFESAKKKGETAALKTKELYDPNKIIEASQACLLLNEAAVLYREAAQECREALSLLSAFTLSEDKEILGKAVQNFEDSANFCLAEAGEWTRKEKVQRENLKEQLQSLEENCASCLEKGMQRSAWVFQKQMLPILQELVRCQEVDETRLIHLQNEIELYEKRQDENRLTEAAASLSSDQFFDREKHRSDLSGNLFSRTLLRPRPIRPIIGN